MSPPCPRISGASLAPPPRRAHARPETRDNLFAEFRQRTRSGFLDLSEPAVHVDLDASDVRGVFRCEKRYRSRHFFRLSEPLHGDHRRASIEGFFREPRLFEDRGDNRPRRDRVHADAAPNELRSRRSCQGSQCRLCRGICARSFDARAARDTSIQNDRLAIIEKWQRVMNGDVCTLDVRVKLLVEQALRGLGERREFSHSRVHE